MAYKEEYHQMPATYVSQSTLKVFLQSPEDYYYSYILGNSATGVSTATTSLGSLVHTLLLEPLEVENRYVVLSEAERPEADKGMTSTKNKVWKESKFQEASEQSKELVQESTMALAKDMVAVLATHPTAKEYFWAQEEWTAYTEQTILWKLEEDQEEEDAILLKSKLDKLLVRLRSNGTGEAIIVDYKTTAAANLEQFGWSVKKYGYDIQSAFYEDAAYYFLEQHYPGVEFGITTLFVPQRTTAPYAVLGVVQLDYQTVNNARARYREGLLSLKGCLHTGCWTKEGITVLQLSKPLTLFPEGELPLPFAG